MNYRVSLDIGTHRIRAAIAEQQKDGSMALVGLISVPSSGVRRSTVDNSTQLTQALSPVIAYIKSFSRGAVKQIIAGIDSSDLKIQQSKGVVAVSRADDEIYQDDINRVLQSAKALNLPPNRTVITSVIKEYIVDGINGISDPLGMIGKRLEVTMLVVDVFSPSAKNIERCVETLGAAASQLVVSPIAAAEAVLTQSQKDLGSFIVDIGAGTTKIALFEENRLSHVAVIPVGGASITNDLAIGLRIPIETAEIIKLSYGSALAKEVSARDAVELSKIDPRTKGTVTKKFIAEIIEDRLAEIFELVNTEVKRVGKASQLPAGAVIVGGTAKMPNIAELARQELKISAQIGAPDMTALAGPQSDLNTQAEDPEFATVIGLLYSRETDWQEAGNSKLSSSFKKILNYFIP